jgi:hypothetical protein
MLQVIKMRTISFSFGFKLDLFYLAGVDYMSCVAEVIPGPITTKVNKSIDVRKLLSAIGYALSVSFMRFAYVHWCEGLLRD